MAARVTKSGLWWFCAVSLGLNLELHFPRGHICVCFQDIIGQRDSWNSGCRSETVARGLSWPFCCPVWWQMDARCPTVQMGLTLFLVNVQLFFPTLSSADHPKCLTVDPQTWQQLLIDLAMNSPFQPLQQLSVLGFREMTSKVGDAFSILQLCSLSKNVGAVFP